MRQPPVWSNGDAATVSRPSSHRNISRGSRCAASPAASAAAAPIITARRSRRTRSTARYACDSPQKWRSRNPDYWRRYREQHPAAVERNRQQQHVRDQKRRLRDLANNNSAFDLKHSAAEVWLLGAGPPESCKQQLSSGASLDFGSTSAPQTAAVGILQTTTSWHAGGFCRITEIAPCSPPIRSTTCIACTGPSAGRSARSSATCA